MTNTSRWVREDFEQRRCFCSDLKKTKMTVMSMTSSDNDCEHLVVASIYQAPWGTDHFTLSSWQLSEVNTIITLLSRWGNLRLGILSRQVIKGIPGRGKHRKVQDERHDVFGEWQETWCSYITGRMERTQDPKERRVTMWLAKESELRLTGHWEPLKNSMYGSDTVTFDLFVVMLACWDHFAFCCC